MNKFIVIFVVCLVGNVFPGFAQEINVTANGVGIGTANPTATLTVSGNDDARIKVYSNGGSIGVIDTVANTNDSNGRWLGLNPSGGHIGIGTTLPFSAVEILGQSGQLTANLTDAGSRSASLALNVNTGDYGSGAAITFGNNQSNDAGSIGFAAIKGLLTNGGLRTIGDLAFSTRYSFSDNYLTERMRITSAGNIGINTVNPSHRFTVNGIIKSKGYIEDGSNWADYVFDPSYKLASLTEVEAHIKDKKHLPGVPSEADVIANGLDLGEMSRVQMAQIEQLMLYVIAQEKRLSAQERRIAELEAARRSR